VEIMVMPLVVYTEARLRARYHVQVEYERIKIPATPAYVDLCARVRRIFRNDGSLNLDDVIKFQVPVYPESNKLLIPPGGDFWSDGDVLNCGRYMEAFLNGTPPVCSLAASQRELIDALTDSPVMDIPTEDEVAAAWDAFNRPQTSSSRKSWRG
jgi:hypothetical protein